MKTAKLMLFLVLFLTLAGCSFGDVSDPETQVPDEDGPPAGESSTATRTAQATPDLEHRAEEHTPIAACRPGTDPPAGTSDTSGDGIPDAWLATNETPGGVALPDGDPCKMNLYIQVVYTGDAGLPPGVLNTTEKAFEDMPVRNPDGTTGINLHIDEGPRLNKTVNYTGDNFVELKQSYYENVTGDRAGIYHLALIVTFEADVTREKSGVAEAPDRFLILQNSRERHPCRCTRRRSQRRRDGRV